MKKSIEEKLCITKQFIHDNNERITKAANKRESRFIRRQLLKRLKNKKTPAKSLRIVAKKVAIKNNRGN